MTSHSLLFSVLTNFMITKNTENKPPNFLYCFDHMFCLIHNRKKTNNNFGLRNISTKAEFYLFINIWFRF